VRILLDYRPALRARSGVGEYVHQLAKALAQPGTAAARAQSAGRNVAGASLPATTDEIVVFSSSWKDRPDASSVRDLGNVRLVDRRWPVRLLNLAWHRFGWPPIELLAWDRFDVVHSPHPLLLPCRHAAQVVTIHDLDFLTNPARTRAEIRRDYGTLAADHARRADRVIVPSRYTASQVERHLEVPAGRISICAEGTPDWVPAGSAPSSGQPRGFILFLGTLDGRKNIAGLLAAYRVLRERHPGAPKLVLAGKAPPEAGGALATLASPPLAGHVEYLGYIRPEARQALYQDAGLLVLPSFDEGFGLPVVEAMSLGVPVVAANRGALPEVLGDAGLLVEPDDPEGMAGAMGRILTDAAFAAQLAERGRERARLFSWERCAAATRDAYALAVAARHARQAQRQSADGRNQ